MKAPKITTKMVLSADLVLNTWQRMIDKIRYDYIGKSAPSIVGRKEWSWVDLHNNDDYFIKAMLIHKEGHELCIYSEVDNINGHLKINDEIVDPYTSDGFYHFYKLPDTIKSGDVYHVIYGAWFDDTPNMPDGSDTKIASKPWETPTAETLAAQLLDRQLNDFTISSPNPTIQEWNDVSEVINAMDDICDMQTNSLANIRNYTDGLTDTDNVETVTQKTIITHGYNDLHIRFSIGWPVELNQDRFLYTMMFDIDIKDKNNSSVYKWKTVLTQTRGSETTTLPPGSGNVDNIKIQSARGFNVGDHVSIADVHGTTFVITAISGTDNEAVVSLDYNNTTAQDQYIWGYQEFYSIPDDSYYDDSLKIYKNDDSDDAQDYHIVYPTDSFTTGDNYTVITMLTYRRHSGSTLDPYGHKAVVYYVGEYERPGQQQPFGLLPMTPWKKCDTVPESGSNTINAIIENVRTLQSIKHYDNTPNTQSIEACYHPYDNGNRCNCDGFIGVRKLQYLTLQARENATDNKVHINYWNGVEWESKELSISDTMSSYDIRKKFPNLRPGNFYSVTGEILYAFETSSQLTIDDAEQT